MSSRSATRPFRVIDHALAAEAVRAVRRAVLASAALGESQLAGTFQHTRGFGLVFRAREVSAVCERNAWAQPFFRLALDDAPSDANAWYFNALVVPAGGAVGAHVDTTLREPAGDETARAARVTVLYLTRAGGVLRLLDDGAEVATVTPAIGRMVSFDGRLTHEVARGDPEDPPRVSLVLEHYALGPSALVRLAPRLSPGAHGLDDEPLWARAAARGPLGPFASLLRPRGA